MNIYNLATPATTTTTTNSTATGITGSESGGSAGSGGKGAGLAPTTITKKPGEGEYSHSSRLEQIFADHMT